MHLGSVNLGRTFDPKYSHYTSDGMGRDSYIKANDGGLTSSYFSSPMTGFQSKLVPNLLSTSMNQPHMT
jgi:hypothetical protein